MWKLADQTNKIHESIHHNDRQFNPSLRQLDYCRQLLRNPTKSTGVPLFYNKAL